MNPINTPSGIYLNWTEDFRLVYDFSRKRRNELYNEMMNKNPVVFNQIRESLKNEDYETYCVLLKEDKGLLELITAYTSIAPISLTYLFEDIENDIKF